MKHSRISSPISVGNVGDGTIVRHTGVTNPNQKDAVGNIMPCLKLLAQPTGMTYLVESTGTVEALE